MVNALFARFVFERQSRMCFQSCHTLQGRQLTIYSLIPICYGLRADPGTLILYHFRSSLHCEREIHGGGGELQVWIMVWTVSVSGLWCDIDSICHTPQF